MLPPLRAEIHWHCSQFLSTRPNVWVLATSHGRVIHCRQLSGTVCALLVCFCENLQRFWPAVSCQAQLIRASLTILEPEHVPVPVKWRLDFYASSQNCDTRLLASSCLSVRMQQLDSHWTDFHEIWYLGISWKSVEKIQVSLKSGVNNGSFTWKPLYMFHHISLS